MSTPVSESSESNDKPEDISSLSSEVQFAITSFNYQIDSCNDVKSLQTLLKQLNTHMHLKNALVHKYFVGEWGQDTNLSYTTNTNESLNKLKGNKND